ncbi:MAG: galactose oxidase [Planctomycetaceae bacterium]
MPHTHLSQQRQLALLQLTLTLTLALAVTTTAPAFAQLTTPATTPAFSLTELPPIPDAEGFAGSFAGISNNHLLVIGGANFPDKKPWDGGSKTWSDRIYALPLSIPRSLRLGQTPKHPALLMNRTPWKLAGRNPTPTGYGVSATFHDEVLCVGGSNPTQHYSSVTAVRYQNSTPAFRQLPPLPRPLANHCGTLVGNLLYIAGGQTDPNSAPAETAAWTLDLNHTETGWIRLPDCPGTPRILATAATTGQDFWMIGGASLRPGSDGKPVRTWLKDAWRYSPELGWQQLPDLPAPRVAAPSPAPAPQQTPVLLGGDDGSQAGNDPRTHQGFTTTSLSLAPQHTQANLPKQWLSSSPFPPAVVTTTTVHVDDFWIIPSGEIRPGIRSPKVWLLLPTPVTQ